MPSSSFHCPECDTLLKPARPIPSGQQVRCPRCDAVFAAPETEYPDPNAAEPVVAQVAPRRGTDDDDRFAQRPRRRRKKQGRPAVLIGLGVGAGVLVLALGAGILLFWLLRSADNQGTGNEDPLAYVPADSAMIMGMDFGTLMDDPGMGRLIQATIHAQEQGRFLADVKKETGLEFRDLFDKVIVALHGDLGAMVGPQSTTIIVRSRLPFSQDKIRRSIGKATRQSLNGKTYYKVEGQEFSTAFMPSDYILILSDLPPEKLLSVVASDGVQPLVRPEVAEQARQASKSQFWFIVPVTNSLRSTIHRGITEDNTVPAPDEMKPLLEAIKGAKVIAFWAALAGDQIQLELALTCDDETRAREAVDAVDKAWKQQTKGWGGVGAIIGMAMMPAELRKIAAELIKTTQFRQTGPVAQGSARIGVQTLRDLIQAGMNNPAFLGQP